MAQIALRKSKYLNQRLNKKQLNAILKRTGYKITTDAELLEFISNSGDLSDISLSKNNGLWYRTSKNVTRFNVLINASDGHAWLITSDKLFEYTQSNQLRKVRVGIQDYSKLLKISLQKVNLQWLTKSRFAKHSTEMTAYLR